MKDKPTGHLPLTLINVHPELVILRIRGKSALRSKQVRKELPEPLGNVTEPNRLAPELAFQETCKLCSANDR